MCDLNLGWGSKNKIHYRFCTEVLDKSRKKKKSQPCVKFASNTNESQIRLNVIFMKAFPPLLNPETAAFSVPNAAR